MDCIISIFVDPIQTLLGSRRGSAGDGLLAHFLHDTLSKTQGTDWRVDLHVFELFNEDAYDLLSGNGSPLRIAENKAEGWIYFEDTYPLPCESMQELTGHLEHAAKKQVGGAQSHLLYEFVLSRAANQETGEEETIRTVCFVQLAAAERTTGSASSQRSLHVLSDTLRGEADYATVSAPTGGARNFSYAFSFRDSKLTRYLRSFILGNAVMIACLVPSGGFEENLRTLALVDKLRKYFKDPTCANHGLIHESVPASPRGLRQNSAGHSKVTPSPAFKSPRRINSATPDSKVPLRSTAMGSAGGGSGTPRAGASTSTPRRSGTATSAASSSALSAASIAAAQAAVASAAQAALHSPKSARGSSAYAQSMSLVTAFRQYHPHANSASHTTDFVAYLATMDKVLAGLEIAHQAPESLASTTPTAIPLKPERAASPPLSARSSLSQQSSYSLGPRGNVKGLVNSPAFIGGTGTAVAGIPAPAAAAASSSATMASSSATSRPIMRRMTPTMDPTAAFLSSRPAMDPSVMPSFLSPRTSTGVKRFVAPGLAEVTTTTTHLVATGNVPYGYPMYQAYY